MTIETAVKSIKFEFCIDPSQPAETKIQPNTMSTEKRALYFVKHGMENSTLVTNISTPNSPGYELCLGWKNVRDLSVPLAAFGAVLSNLQPFLSFS